MDTTHEDVDGLVDIITMTADDNDVVVKPEPHSDEAALERLHIVAPLVPVAVPSTPTRLAGDSNDAWLLDDVVLRVCWRGDLGRLPREAEITSVLPDGIPHPAVRNVGRSGSLSWVLTDRVPGVPLSSAWQEMVDGERRGIVSQVAAMFDALHDWSAPEAVAVAVQQAEPNSHASVEQIVGTTMVPLPASQLRPLVAAAASVPFMPPDLMDRLDRLVSDLEPIEFTSGQVFVHGDASPGNLLVNGGAVTAMLDFEWARFGPADLELLPWVVWTERHDPQGQSKMLDWFRIECPRLFAAADLDERLLLYQVAYNLRGLFVWLPDGPENTLPPSHPVGRLRQLATTRSPYVPV